MNHEIKCKKRKCFDEDSIEYELEEVYDKNNPIQQIESDLLKGMLGQ
jgi:hypothetical protein